MTIKLIYSALYPTIKGYLKALHKRNINTQTNSNNTQKHSIYKMPDGGRKDIYSVFCHSLFNPVKEL